MRGLRTQETKKFNAFFELVQNKAHEREAVFFLESGDGNDFETDVMAGEDLQGWLVPLSKADEFEAEWKAGAEDDKWVEFFCWAEWFTRKNAIDVRFTGSDAS
jgi:hypothetical protein